MVSRKWSSFIIFGWSSPIVENGNHMVLKSKRPNIYSIGRSIQVHHQISRMIIMNSFSLKFSFKCIEWTGRQTCMCEKYERSFILKFKMINFDAEILQCSRMVQTIYKWIDTHTHTRTHMYTQTNTGTWTKTTTTTKWKISFVATENMEKVWVFLSVHFNNSIENVSLFGWCACRLNERTETASSISTFTMPLLMVLRPLWSDILGEFSLDQCKATTVLIDNSYFSTTPPTTHTILTYILMLH